MEFCPEFAVINSALQLVCHVKGDGKQEILLHVVSEVLEGLSHPCETALEQAQCLEGLILNLQVKCWESLDDSAVPAWLQSLRDACEPVTAGMPPVPQDLVFDLVTLCQAHGAFFKTLLYVPRDIALASFQSLMQYFSMNTQESHARWLLKALQYLGLWHNPILHGCCFPGDDGRRVDKHNDSDWQMIVELVAEMCKVIDNADFSAIADEEVALSMLALVNLSIFLTTGITKVVKGPWKKSYGVQDLELSRNKRPSNAKKENTNAEAGNILSPVELLQNRCNAETDTNLTSQEAFETDCLLAAVTDEELPVVNIRSSRGLDDGGSLVKLAATLCDYWLMPSVLAAVCMTRKPTWDPTICGGTAPYYGLIWSRVCHAIAKQVSNTLKDKASRRHLSGECFDWHVMWTVWEPFTVLLRTLEAELKDDPKMHLDRTLYLIRKKLAGYSDKMKVLLNSLPPELLLEDSIITALEDTRECVQDASVWMAVFRQLGAVVNHQGTSRNTADRYRQVLLSGMKVMSRATQNAVLDRCLQDHSQSALQRLFDADDHFRQRITSSFNRFVHEGQEDHIVGEVAALALQSAGDTLRKIVESAVSNKGQVEILAKVLRVLPSLSFSRSDDGRHGALLSILGEYIGEASKLSRQENKNLYNLCGLLMKLQTDIPGSKAPGRVIVKPSDLLSAIVLPQLSQTLTHETAASGSASSNRICLLQFLSLALELDSGSSAKEAVNVQSVVVTVYTACCCLHRVESLLCGCHGDNVDLLLQEKALCMKNLDILGKYCGVHPECISAQHVAWLDLHLGDHPWTVGWRVYSVLWPDAHGPHRYRLMLPRAVQTVCAIPPDLDVCLVDEPDSDIVALMAFCQLTDHTTKISREGIKDCSFRDDPKIYAKLVLGVAMTTRASLPEEWLRVGTLLQVLGDRNLLGPDPGAGVRGLLADVAAVLSASVDTESPAPRISWSAVCKGLAVIFKEIFLAGSPSADDILRTFDTTCQCLRHVPAAFTDQLLPLALDALTQLQNLVENADTQDRDKWRTQLNHVIQSVESESLYDVLTKSVSKFDTTKQTTL